MRRGTRFAPAARRSDNHGESDHEARALRRACHPATAPAQAQPKGGGARTAEQPHGSSLRSTRHRLRPVPAVAPSARRLRPRSWAERSNGPNGCLVPNPLCMRRGAQGLADQGSRLSERSEFERDPAGREHRRLPGAKRRDAGSRAALLWLLSLAANESDSPAGANTRHLRAAQKNRPPHRPFKHGAKYRSVWLSGLAATSSGGALAHYLAAAFWPHVDHPICRFDHDDGVARVRCACGLPWWRFAAPAPAIDWMAFRIAYSGRGAVRCFNAAPTMHLAMLRPRPGPTADFGL